MEIPALNTQGIEIGNTLLKIKQLQELDQSRDRNALLAEKNNPLVVDTQNAYKKAETQGKVIDNQKALFEHAKQGLEWVQANVEIGNDPAYANYYEHMTKNMKMPLGSLPAPDAFYDTLTDEQTPGGKIKRFNKDRFGKWASRAATTSKDIEDSNFKNAGLYEQKTFYGPENKTMVIPVKKGEIYDPEKELGKGWSAAELKPPKEEGAPTTRTIQRGEQKVSQEWDKKTKTWIDVAEGPAWNAKPPKEQAPDRTLVEVQQPDGTTVWMPRAQAAGKPSPSKQTGPTETEKRTAEKDISDLESKILGKDDKGNPNAENPAVEPLVTRFNRNANTSYAYRKIPKKSWYGGEGFSYERVPLPKTAKGQVTAKDVADTAKVRGISYEEALTKILELAGAKK
jgi:hypothetical protein